MLELCTEDDLAVCPNLQRRLFILLVALAQPALTTMRARTYHVLLPTEFSVVKIKF